MPSSEQGSIENSEAINIVNMVHDIDSDLEAVQEEMSKFGNILRI
jgi:hypothetical protein